MWTKAKGCYCWQKAAEYRKPDGYFNLNYSAQIHTVHTDRQTQTKKDLPTNSGVPSISRHSTLSVNLRASPKSIIFSRSLSASIRFSGYTHNQLCYFPRLYNYNSLKTHQRQRLLIQAHEQKPIFIVIHSTRIVPLRFQVSAVGGD